MPDHLRDQLQERLTSAFILERELGGGGMSRVFVAIDTSLGREIVIKVLPPDMAAGVSIDRFKREIAVAARLQHPHIVPLFSASDVDGLPYFTMPFVEGESLRARLATTGELPLSEAVRVLREVASALAYAHEKGVVHRDIKPDNILLSGGSAMVTDFGVAKALTSSSNGDHGGLTSLGIALGTPAYMSPEQASADPQTDHRADIYSFGVLAYELLTGQPPFSGRTPQGLLAAHVTEQPDPVTRRRASIPAPLAALVMRCLEKRASDRPQTAQEIVHALDAITTPSGGTEPTSARPMYIASPSRSRRAMRIGLGVAAILMIASTLAIRRNRGAKAGDAVAPQRVVVATFQNKSGDPSLAPVGDMAADWIARGLAGTGIVDVAGTAAELQARAGVQVASAGSTIEQLGREARAGLVISGAYYKQGDSLFFQADFNDVREHKLMQSVGPIAAPISRPLDGIEVLRQRVTGALAPILDSTLAGAAQAIERPPSYEAYREFLRAEALFYSNEDAARQAFAHTVSLDSTYSYPLLRLISVTNNQRRFAEADSLARVADGRRARLTPYENAYLDFLEGVLATDVAAQLRNAERMRALAPSSAFPRYLEGEALNKSGQVRRALALLDSLDPMSGALRGRVYYYTYRASALHALADYEGLATNAERARAQYPRAALAVQLQGIARSGQGRDIAALLDTLADMPDKGRVTIMGAATNALYEARAHDRPDAAQRAIASWIERHLPSGTDPGAQAERAWAYVALHQWSLLVPLADSLLPKGSADPLALMFRALAAAESGDKKTARDLAGRLDALTPGGGALDRTSLTLQQATIAAAVGDFTKAVALLGARPAHGWDTNLYHSSIIYELLRSYPGFQALIVPRG